MSIKSIECYFDSNVYKPFYMVVGDESYSVYRRALSEISDIEFIYLSDFCKSADKKPDIDKLRETLRMADIDFGSNKLVVLGLGEYLALEGKEKANHLLREMLSFNLGSAHVVFLLRGVSGIVKHILNSDPRYIGRQIEIDNRCISELSFYFSSQELSYFDKDGIKSALKQAELGETLKIQVNSSLHFENAIYDVKILSDSYEAIKKILNNFSVEKDKGNSDEWDTLLREVQHKRSIDFVFSSYGFDADLTSFYQRTTCGGFESWLYYIFLLIDKERLTNKYLKYILDKSKTYKHFCESILNAISEIPRTNSEYWNYYFDRKILIERYPDADLAAFIVNNRKKLKESIYRLTDNTLVEREEIIALISTQGIPNDLGKLYPALQSYLKQYEFYGDALDDFLTQYFSEYKSNKVLNHIDDSFLKKVDELAITREYNRLRTRDEIVASIDATETFLCWVDALGAEYVSYITDIAKEKGLAISVSVGRANLPTITSMNKQFFISWPTEQKRKIEELDETKHKEKGGYRYGEHNLYPIHLAKELDILKDVVNEAATNLSLRKCEKYVITGDHGASRLAVIRRKEEKYDTDTRGEHSGRCCEAFSNYELPFSTEENGYIVLADYGRFKGGRAANVEVHGGASLEEIVVPIITLSLKDRDVVIKMVEENVKADYNQGITFTLFVNKSIDNFVWVEVDGKKHKGDRLDENHFKINVPDIRRAGKYHANIFLDDNLVSQINITAIGKSASLNKEFDELF